MEYTDAALDALRLEGDPLADEVIAALAASGQIEAVNTALQQLQHSGEALPAGLPPVLAAYLRDTADPPPDVDYARLRRVREFFKDDGMHISTLLALGAMVGCYAVPHGAKLLSMTHRLNQPRRRMAETGQFTLYMMGAEAFEAGSQFTPAVQKVRLIHARVRHLIQASGQWPAHHGVPICQEDLLGALMLFSIQLLEAMERMGATPTPQEADDYYYTWCVAGRMLGIRADIIPPTIAEARALNVVLKRRHIGPSDEGRELTHDLLTMFEVIVPGTICDGLVPALVRLVVEDEIADMMDVPRSGWDRVMDVVPKLVARFEHLEDDHAAIRYILDQVSFAMLNSQMRFWTEGHPVHYDIPADLRGDWSLGPAPGGGCPMAAHRPAPAAADVAAPELAYAGHLA